MAGYRRQIDDGAVVAQVRHHRAADVEGAIQINAHDLLPVGVLHVADPLARVDAGGVDQMVNPAMTLGNRRAGADAGLLVADIQQVATDRAFPTLCEQLGLQHFQRGLVDVRQCQAGTCTPQHPRAGAADAAGGAGDQNGFAVESNHCFPSGDGTRQSHLSDMLLDDVDNIGCRP
ncbi:hypothetical protein D9M71_534340 [compost metagenome]